MDSKHISIETITAKVGRWNLDIAAGWEAGLRGKQRVGGRLNDRRPPEHFMEAKNSQRMLDWVDGRDAAVRYRSNEMQRTVHFSATNKDGEVTIVRKGWGVRRGDVISQLEEKGCFGDVHVFYFNGTEIVRSVNCGI